MKVCTRLLGFVLCVVSIATGIVPTDSAAQSCAIDAPEWAPRGTAKTARPNITVTLVSTCGAAIDLSSIRMTVNGEAVAPKTEGTGPKVTVVYVPAAALVEEEDHTIVVRARDAKGTAGEKTWTFHVADTYSR